MADRTKFGGSDPSKSLFLHFVKKSKSPIATPRSQNCGKGIKVDGNLKIEKKLIKYEMHLIIRKC
jgi:hypothetical protein